MICLRNSLQWSLSIKTLLAFTSTSSVFPAVTHCWKRSQILLLSADTVHGLGKALRLAQRSCSSVASEKPSLEPPNQQSSSFERFNVLQRGWGEGGKGIRASSVLLTVFPRHELKRNNFKSHFNLPFLGLFTRHVKTLYHPLALPCSYSLVSN